MAEIAVAVASEVAKCLVAPVGRHCGYVIYSDRRVCELNVEVKKLGEKKDEMQRSIDDAQNNMKPIKAMVETWMTEVETVANKARDVLDYDGSAQKTCFYGWLPNPKARYRLGNDASKMIKEIKDLIVLGQFERVYDESSPPGRVDSTPRVNSSAGDGGNTLFKSQASTFQDVIKALCDEKHKVIGVYGPGGVGKTTLLEIVEEELKKKGKPFRMIVKSEVSQNPDVTKIQYDIAYGLDLKDMKNEPSEKGRRDLLSKRLQMNPSEKVLIILDDVWAELDLKAVGIPLGNESMNCKLLLTSRDERVLQRMLADQTFPLKSLEEEEALKLFETIVGDRLRDDKELKVKAAQVVTKLAGLPLLITSVATILKRSNVSTWENMLRKIEDPNIERIVKWSYDHVESEDAKCLFLLCGLIGGTVKVELLLGLGMGLGLFEGYNERVQYSRNRLNEMLDSLHSFCLLQDGGDGKKNVTIHDLYSEVVVSYAFRGQDSLMMNSNYGPRSKEKLEKCWAICLADVDKDRLDKLMMCRFPDLKILMLSEPKGWPKHKVGDCSGLLDFTYMKELRVLYFRFMRIASLPPSIGILENLHSLYLDDCIVKDVAILGKLKALQILSFARSTISRLPKEIGELTNLRSLNLSKCYNLETIEPGVLKGLTNLEELRIYSFSQWMGKDQIPSKSCNARLVELKSLTKLFALEIMILDPTILLEDGDLPFGNLDRFEIDIGQFVGLKFKDLRIMKLNLEGCESILSKEWVQKTLQKIQCLLLCNLSEFKKSAHELCTQGFEEVKYINIKDSPSIKYIANSSDGLPLTAFRMLESLILRKLIKLEKICNGPVTPGSFSKLRAIIVTSCHRLKYLWSLSDWQRLIQLEEIEVQKCDSMQSIVTYDAVEGIVSTNDRVELPSVRRLRLLELPNMMSFCTKVESASEDTPIQVSLPLLESLEMNGLLGLEKILYSEPSLKYSNLRSLAINNSRSTSKSILKLDWILKLPNLKSMDIAKSPSAEVVFDLEELNVRGDVEILSQLAELTLNQLPNLQCLWKRDVKLQGISILRNLRDLYIQTTLLSFFFPVSVAKYVREIERIEVCNCPNMKAVIVDEGRNEGTYDIIEFPLLECLTIRKCSMEKFFSYPCGKKEPVTTTLDSQDANSDSFFDRKVSLPNLTYLQLHSVGSFKRIWPNELSRSSLCKLDIITIENCSDLLHIFPSTIVGRLHNLKSVEVKNCPSLKSLFDFGSLDSNTEQNAVLLPELVKIVVESCPSLESLLNCGSLDSNAEHKIILVPKLEEVRVSGAKKLRHVVMSHSQMVLNFPSLRTVSVENCSDLRYLFSKYSATSLMKLERLEITKCEQMKEVILEKEAGRSEEEVMSFPCLSELILKELDNLISFGSGSVKRQLGETAEENDESPQPLFNKMVTFPNIIILEINGLRCKELWNNQIPTDSFQKLEYLLLNNCDNLQRIATSYMWKRLQRCLEKLEVISCCLIEIIYEGDGMDIESGKLRRLVLRGLENLRCIWQSDSLPNMPFPNLRDVEAVRCPHLKMLFPTFNAKFLRQIEELVVESCENMELIAGHEKWEEPTGTTITFSELTSLRLFELPKFKSFLPEKYSLKFPCSEDFPSLQVLSIESCGAEPDQVLGDWLYHKTEQEHRSARRRFMRIKHPSLIFRHWPPLDMAR